MRATLISNIALSISFSFEPEGLIYTSGSRYVDERCGRVLFEYHRLEKTYQKYYDIDESKRKYVFVYDTYHHMFSVFSSVQPESTIFDVNIAKREVLVEKIGTHLKSEFKRMQIDPVYFYMKYCKIKGR